MKYKTSKYNLFIPYGNRYIVYNTLTTALILVEEDEYSQMKNGIYVNEEMLVKEGIIVDCNKNEQDVIDFDRIESIHRKNVRNVRILTTTACNAQCAYCFEKGVKQYTMSPEVCDAVVKYISLTSVSGDRVKVCWFGGEPLLNMNAIEKITNQLEDISKRNKFMIYYSMVTNGSLITETLARKMAEQLKIRNVQITLDGFSDVYDSIKQYKDPQRHYFYKIIENVEYLIKNCIMVSIRINYVEENYDSIMKLLKFLKIKFSECKYVKCYVYPVWNVGIKNTYFYQDSKKLINLYKTLEAYRLAQISQIVKLRYRKSQCMACNEHSFCILPNGDLIKCTQEIERVVGNVYEGITNESEIAAWTTESLDEQCQKCVYLPMCQGGCKANEFGHMNRCFSNKEIFPELIKWYAENNYEGKVFKEK